MSDKHYVGLDLSSYEDNGSKYAISRVTLITADNEYFTAGDDTGLEITAECPYATQAMVDAILAQLKGYKFQGYSAESANLDPAAELGDGITASGIYSVIGKISDDGTGYVDVSAPGEAELDEEYPTIGPQTQEFQRNLQATRKQIEDNNRDLRLAIDNATQYITGNDGGYVVIRMNEDNKPYEILIMDTDDINTAKNVWRWNKSGFGHSNKGYQGPFETAITQDGSIVATYITTGALNAVIVSTGILKSKDGETFYLDLDKGILRMKASSLTISGQTVDEISQSKANSAANSALSSAKSYSDSNLVTAKKYADSAADGAFDDVTQLEVFNRLTGGGSKQGIYLENGKVYINASYIGTGYLSADLITTGKISSQNGKVYFDLTNNELRCDRLISTQTYSNVKDTIADISRRNIGGSSYVYGLQVYNQGYENQRITLSPGLGSTPSINTGTLDSPSGILIRSIVEDGRGSGPASIAQAGYIEIGGSGIIELQPPPGSTGINANITMYPGYYGNVISGYNSKVTIDAYTLDITTTNASFSNKITVRGSKSRAIDTKDYETRLQYCYETPSPMFGDVGQGKTDENGECYIYLDDIFIETIAEKMEYQVFLQKEGPGDLWISEKNRQYFIVRGTENLKFAWELKARQRDYEYERLETLENDNTDAFCIPYEEIYIGEINRLIEEQEALLNETA